VGVYNCATMPKERKKGIMQGLLSYSLFKAQVDGYKHAVLYSTAEGKNVYQRLGFKPCSTYELYEEKRSSDEIAQINQYNMDA